MAEYLPEKLDTFFGDDKGEDGNEVTPTKNQKNPLELIPVIKGVLQYMNVEELKICRLVSQEWSSAGLFELKRRSKIVFRQLGPKEKFGTWNRHPGRFFEQFSKDSLAIPFTAFEFIGYEKAKWEEKILRTFFLSEKNKLHEVYLNSVNLIDDKGKRVDRFEVTPWISDSPITMPNKRSTKLSISQEPFCTKFMVPMSTLTHVKKVALSGCVIILNEKVKISPAALTLTNNLFFKKGDLNKLTNVCINDSFDLSKSKEIGLKIKSLGNDELINVTMSLDFSSNNLLALDSLALSNIKLINWGTCNWVVKKLFLYTNPLIEKTEMKIKELYFYCSIIDLSVIPKSVEKLKVTIIANIESLCFCSQAVDLPDLKCLTLQLKVNLSGIFPHFVNYPLVELNLGSDEKSSEIHFASIPQTVKKLKLKRVRVKIQKGDGNLNLDVLVLEDYSFNPQSDLLRYLTSSHFKTEELVVVSSRGIKADTKLIQFLHFDKKCLGCHQNFYIGPFQWFKPLAFQKSVLRKYVDSESEYYLFKNGMGKAYDREEFVKMQAVGLKEEPFFND